MSLIPQPIIKEIQAKARIEEYIGKYVSLKKEGIRYRGLCPFHNEKSPSFSVNPEKQMFKCFGCGEGGDVFTFVMKYEKQSYREAVKTVAAFYNIPIEDENKYTINPNIHKPEVRQVDATPEQADGTVLVETTEWTKELVCHVAAEKTWDYLLKTAPRPKEYANTPISPEERIANAIAQAATIFTRYHFYPLASYTIIKNRKATTIRSTADFPIYMFDEGTWKKIYKPLEPEKKNRFFYTGKRHDNFIHGLQQLADAHEDNCDKLDQEEEDEDNKKKKPKDARLEAAIYCSGGSDGLNLALLNHYPLWSNSESSKLTEGQFKQWLTHVKKVYHLPDIDRTGLRTAHELAMAHLDLYTIYLPQELSQRYVKRGYGKDFRDYMQFYTAWDFLKLMKVAYPYRFWDQQPTYNKQGEFIGMRYNVRNKYMYNFLARNGFYRYKSENEKDGYIYIHIRGHVVHRVEAKDIRDFINKFIEDRKLDAELMDTFLRTSQLNESSLSNLPFIEIDFTDYDRDTQWMFFQNSVFKITAQGVEELSSKDCDKYVWEDELLGHEAEVLPDFFTIKKNDDGVFDILIHNSRCMVLRYLINASRICWREELENRLEGFADPKELQQYCERQNLGPQYAHLAQGLTKEAREKYLAEHRWDIAGPLLTPAEQQEQKLHLINKIYALGYMLHRYKNSSRAWCTWAMDNKITEMSESHGGSGKSICMKLLSHFMRTEYIEGRNPKITDNPHIWGNVTRHTDFIFVDDCSQYLKFDFFFPSITGPMNCNPKNAKQYTIAFQDVGKIGFASNYPPYGIDPSAERRILYLMFSDYYHYNRFDEYREERRVFDDFGKNLIDDFNEDDWNLASNFLAQCVKFYLSCPVKINPPMDNVNKRNLKAEMGDAFQAWADVYWAEDGRFNTYLSREELFEDFRLKTKQQFTPQKFLKSMKAWCHFNGHEFNPKEHLNKEGRIIRKHKHKDANGNEVETSKEMFYIKKAETALAEGEEGSDLPF